MVGRILGDAGYTVLSAPGGAEALEIAAGLDEPVDVLVTDVIMPGLLRPGGRRAHRASSGRPRTLFLSGYTADALRDRANLPPGSAFLEKPFAPASLRARCAPCSTARSRGLWTPGWAIARTREKSPALRSSSVIQT